MGIKVQSPESAGIDRPSEEILMHFRIVYCIYFWLVKAEITQDQY